MGCVEGLKAKVENLTRAVYRNSTRTDSAVREVATIADLLGMENSPLESSAARKTGIRAVNLICASECKRVILKNPFLELVF